MVCIVCKHYDSWLRGRVERQKPRGCDDDCCKALGVPGQVMEEGEYSTSDKDSSLWDCGV